VTKPAEIHAANKIEYTEYRRANRFGSNDRDQCEGRPGYVASEMSSQKRGPGAAPAAGAEAAPAAGAEPELIKKGKKEVEEGEEGEEAAPAEKEKKK